MPRIAIPGAARRILEVPDLELRVRASEKSAGRLVGHAAIFDAIADVQGHRERVAAGAFRDTIRNDDIRALLNHNPNFVLGRNRAGTLTLREDGQGLAFEISLPDTRFAHDLAVSIKRGDISEMSFAFNAIDDSWSKDRDGMIRLLRRVRLFDVSPVTFPAYSQTNVSVASMRRTASNPESARRRLDLLELE
jgi:HK97 family phage prohead protease